jgi:hypothetical protein
VDAKEGREVTDPGFDELMEAARVRHLTTERELTRWRIHHFTITPSQYERELLSAEFSGDDPERIAMRKSREVPPGDYVVLHRRMTPEEMESVLDDNGLDPDDPRSWQFLPEERQWMPVMSDTPSEIREQRDALENATGRVLITGLGLGCLPHALLTKPSVTRIDIIEIDPEVIELTAPTFTDPRVHIHQGDATKPWAIFPKGTTWDYAWHDIWTFISSANLKDATAEHGISYRRMFTRYVNAVPVQGAWAYQEALKVKEIEDAEAAAEREFERKLKAAPFPEQVEMVYDRAIRSRMRGVFPEDKQLPQEFIDTLDPEGKLKAHIRKALANPKFWEEWARTKAERQERKAKRVSRPNAHLEVTG